MIDSFIDDMPKLDLTCDKAVFIDGFLIGYRDGIQVIKTGPFPDIKTATAEMPLHDKDGKQIIPSEKESIIAQLDELDMRLARSTQTIVYAMYNNEPANEDDVKTFKELMKEKDELRLKLIQHK